MMTNSGEKSWMWSANSSTYGLVVNAAIGKLYWYDAVSCLCGDDAHAIEQTTSEFQQRGTPWSIQPPPSNILTEVHGLLGE